MYTSAISTLLLLTGYGMLWTGVTSQQWRREMGYDHGLWTRCDEDGCIHLVTGLNSYLAPVRVGLLGSLLLYTVVTACLLVQCCNPRSRKSCVTWVIDVCAVLAELLATLSLGLYGFKTVMARAKMPSLLWGFAITVTAVMIALLGSILRAMGPVSGWSRGFSCLLPKRKCGKGQIPYRERQRQYHTGGMYPWMRNQIRYQRRQEPQTMPLLALYRADAKAGYQYVSMPSSRRTSRSRQSSRHSYEEISVSEMPAPPPELLRPLSTSDQCPPPPPDEDSRMSSTDPPPPPFPPPPPPSGDYSGELRPSQGHSDRKGIPHSEHNHRPQPIYTSKAKGKQGQKKRVRHKRQNNSQDNVFAEYFAPSSSQEILYSRYQTMPTRVSINTKSKSNTGKKDKSTHYADSSTGGRQRSKVGW
ncbi:zinc finger CCCH domain-containing protein 18 [Aplysia californica]|uniref:Zinc finger CCCH domain-containing protein 18 n=1 Tax=Aplysia californica TaxID=6500 RepID=A0ABM0JI69_APLCA|nr:zinc finger CCCH domain-containing protein 18 [Aplysia californica]